ncbi:uncharacterized protein LOC141915527 [Tubulanus polymorphus]|uniref:uncharacterized protein LOC141915527 n=1 Tax=Tubulanus polymorphus TaxID=672921 RepID=UPI003DA26773
MDIDIDIDIDTRHEKRQNMNDNDQPESTIKNGHHQPLAVSPLSSFECSKWPGFGGRPVSLSGIEFDKQLDRISQWIDKWDHDQRCSVLELLIQRSDYSQIELLNSVMSPALHRDFIYSARKDYPTNHFIPISTHYTRRIKARHPVTSFYRMKSAYLQEIKEINMTSTERLPQLVQSKRVRTTDSAGRSDVSSQDTDVQLPYISSTESSETTDSSVNNRSLIEDSLKGPACLRFVNMAPQRHIQAEKSYMSDDFIHAWKKRRKTNNTQKRTRENKAISRGLRLVHWYTNMWDDMRRKEFLHKLILKLDARQHYFMSSFLSIKRHRDFITLLPENVALKILGYLSPKELCIAAKVSKKWKIMCGHNELWKAKCAEVKLEFPQKKLSRNPVWKKLYKQGLSSRRNWLHGRCKIIDVKGHANNVLSVIFDDKGKRLVSGSLDQTIRIWNVNTGTLLYTLEGHSRGIWSLQFFTADFLISGSYDCSIKIWNLRTGVAVRTIFGHDGPVWALASKTKLMVSGSQDTTAKIWEVTRCYLKHTLRGHTGAVYTVDLSDDETWVLTGSTDRTVRLWRTDNGSCVTVISASQSTSIMSVSYSRGFMACSYGHHISIYNMATGELIRSYHEHHKRIESIKLKISDPVIGEGILITGGKDNMVKYWDITLDNSLHTFIGHTNQINCITFDELRIASASYDHSIKIWDFS